jgi:hypothetical protein
MFRRKPEYKPHPDPAVELKLRHIRDLDQLRQSCHRLIADSSAEIAAARRDLQSALARHTSMYDPISATRLENAERVVGGRIKRAEETIREQRAVLASLGIQIQEAVDAANLSEFDLAYLRLSSGK